MSFSAPFLVLDENKKMILLPLTLLHKEAPDPVNTASWTEVPNVSTTDEFPLQRWVHVGCEVTNNISDDSFLVECTDLSVCFLGF